MDKDRLAQLLVQNGLSHEIANSEAAAVLSCVVEEVLERRMGKGQQHSCPSSEDLSWIKSGITEIQRELAMKSVKPRPGGLRGLLEKVLG